MVVVVLVVVVLVVVVLVVVVLVVVVVPAQAGVVLEYVDTRTLSEPDL